MSPTRLSHGEKFASKKLHGIRKPNSSSDLRRQVLDERNVVPVKNVSDVENLESKVMYEMGSREGIGSLQVDYGISRGFGLRRKDPVLARGHGDFRYEAESSVTQVKSHPCPQRRNARQGGGGFLQFRVDQVESARDPEIFVKTDVQSEFSPDEAAVGLLVFENKQAVLGFPGGSAEDEVLNVVKEKIGLTPDPVAGVPQGHLEAVASLST